MNSMINNHTYSSLEMSGNPPMFKKALLMLHNKPLEEMITALSIMKTLQIMINSLMKSLNKHPSRLISNRKINTKVCFKLPTNKMKLRLFLPVPSMTQLLRTIIILLATSLTQFLTLLLPIYHLSLQSHSVIKMNIILETASFLKKIGKLERLLRNSLSRPQKYPKNLPMKLVAIIFHRSLIEPKTHTIINKTYLEDVAVATSEV